MRILVLDDDALRLRWLRRMAPKSRVIWVNTVGGLLRVVRSERVWDLVLLDHDLGQCLTGTDAAMQLRVIAPIVVWSLNPIGGPKMVEILEEREQYVIGWIPFGSPELVKVLRTAGEGWYG